MQLFFCIDYKLTLLAEQATAGNFITDKIKAFLVGKIKIVCFDFEQSSHVTI